MGDSFRITGAALNAIQAAAEAVLVEEFARESFPYFYINVCSNNVCL